MTALTEAPADCGLRGLALLDLAIANITLDPAAWEQGAYRCLTGMCVAGHLCELAGGRWLTGPAGMWRHYLLAGPGEHAAFDSGDGTWVISALNRAVSLLGRDPQAPRGGHLFDGGNKLGDIIAIRNELAAAGLS